MKMLLISIIISIFFISFVTANIAVAYDDSDLPIVKIEKDTVTGTGSDITNNTNSSDYWDNLDSPSDISGSEFWYNMSLYVPDNSLTLDINNITNFEYNYNQSTYAGWADLGAMVQTITAGDEVTIGGTQGNSKLNVDGELGQSVVNFTGYAVSDGYPTLYTMPSTQLVGIGTYTPSSVLTIQGLTGNYDLLNITDAGTQVFHIDENGDVEARDIKMYSQGTSNWALFIDASDGGSLFGVQEDSGGASALALYDAGGTITHLFRTNSGSNYILEGNLGLGQIPITWLFELGGQQHPRMLLNGSSSNGEVAILFMDDADTEMFEVGLDNDGDDQFCIGDKYFTESWFCIDEDTGRIFIADGNSATAPDSDFQLHVMTDALGVTSSTSVTPSLASGAGDIYAEGDLEVVGIACGHRESTWFYSGYTYTDTGNEYASRMTALETEGKLWTCIDCIQANTGGASTCASDPNAWMFCEFQVDCVEAG